MKKLIWFLVVAAIIAYAVVVTGWWIEGSKNNAMETVQQ